MSLSHGNNNFCTHYFNRQVHINMKLNITVLIFTTLFIIKSTYLIVNLFRL